MSSTKRQPAGSGAGSDRCYGCPGGCALFGPKSQPVDALLKPPSSAALNAVVGILFGGPLLLLCALVAALEFNAPNAHPLFSLGLVLVTLVVAGWGIAAQRSKLLHRLQVQSYNPNPRF